MALPKQIKEQVERGNKIAATLGMEGVPEGTEPFEDVTGIATMNPDDDGRNDPAREMKIVKQEEKNEPSKEEGKTYSEENSVDSTAGMEPASDAWEQKYKVLQGKYDAEVPRLSAELKEANIRMESMQSVLSSLNTDKEPASAPATAEEKEVLNRLVKDDEIEDYGMDLIDVMRRAARETWEPQFNKLQEENDKLRAQLANVGNIVTHNEQDRFYTGLDAKVPNWREQNDDPKFLAWLKEPDPFSGEIRHTLLTKAFQASDVSRVAAFFTSFNGENAAVNTTAETMENPENKAQVDMAQLVAPGGPKDSGMNQSAPDKPVFTRQQIAAFYADCQRGKYNKKPEERAKIEAAIFDATQHGRIR